MDAYPKIAGEDSRKTAAPAGDMGRYDLSFDSIEPERYRKDVPSAEVHILYAGHFALDTAADDIAAMVRSFVTPSR